MKNPKYAELTQHSVIPAKAGIQANGGGEQTWIPACAGMTSRGGNVLTEPLPFSFSMGVRKIMNHFVVKYPSLLGCAFPALGLCGKTCLSP